MDLSVLTRLPERTRVLIPKYPSSAFRDRLRAGGVRRVIELEPWQRFPLDTRGSWITAIPEQSPMCNAAAFLIVTAGHAVLNCNDARLTAAQARRANILPAVGWTSWRYRHPARRGIRFAIRIRRKYERKSRQTSELASSGQYSG